MSSCGFYLWSHRSSYFHLGTQRFGPGDGEWLVESPDVHGLSSAKLANASALHERRLARRDCFLVVKDGVIVHEAYHNGGDADTLHYVESAGSVAAALLAGAAARHGLLDLDTHPRARHHRAARPRSARVRSRDRGARATPPRAPMGLGDGAR